MRSAQTKALWRIGISLVLFVSVLGLSGMLEGRPIWDPYGILILYLIPYLVIGYDILLKSVRNLRNKQFLDENFLMSIATIGALVIGEYPEAVLVMLLYQIGEFFQSYAVDRSRRSISDLMDIRPDYANIEQDGTLTRVDPDDIKIDDIIVVKAGERVPLDGVVIEGASMVDTSALTGESLPRSVSVGNDVISGCINKNGLLRVRVTKLYEESTVSKILEMVENASEKKAKAENFITRFARVYTPIVVCAAILLAVIPPIVLKAPFVEWLERALIFLVVSCPCALVISVPMSFFGGIGGASKLGVLIKGSNYMETLSEAKTVVFDKTGTLTQGVFQVVAVHPDVISEDNLLEAAALSENFSDHPIAASLKSSYGHEIDASRVKDVDEVAGNGISATVDGRRVLTGNGKLMEKYGINYRPCSTPGTTVHVAIDGEYAGHIVISDAIKPDALETIRELKTLGVKRTVMLTGDAKEVGEHVGKALSIDQVYTNLLPDGKVAKVEELLSDRAQYGTVVFVGDGINDAPVLSRADIGVAMGAMGSDAAIEAADIVLMDDKPSKIPVALRVARKTMRIVKQNIIFALGVKAIVLVLSALGLTNMWLAIFADVGVSILAILNASRALMVGKFANPATETLEGRASEIT